MSQDNKQQVIALGRLGWSLRRIEAAVHIRRETIGYLRSAGIPMRARGGWGWRAPAKPAIEAITDPEPIKAPEPQPGRSPSASACELHRELIEVGLWTTGKSGRRTRAFTAPPNDKSQPCSPKNGRRFCRCDSSLFAITSTANARYTWMAAWKWKPLAPAHRQAGSAAVFRCSGMLRMSA